MVSTVTLSRDGEMKVVADAKEGKKYPITIASSYYCDSPNRPPPQTPQQPTTRTKEILKACNYSYFLQTSKAAGKEVRKREQVKQN